VPYHDPMTLPIILCSVALAAHLLALLAGPRDGAAAVGFLFGAALVAVALAVAGTP